MKQAATNAYRAHYISGTHWDREWYRPFQEYRVLLVKLIDELLDLMETKADFKYFHLDGQTCVLDDYMEIRPENRERLQALIRSGRILIGPWFTMPDLFCVGDEALIRNLLLGRRISREWGVDPMPVGFICDMFGHPSQMPQIFGGFGLHDVVLGRGTNESTTPMFFRWKSPDGTQAVVFKLQDQEGYGAFARPRTCLEKPTFLLAGMKEFVAELEAAGTDPERRRTVQEKAFRRELARYVDHEIQRASGPLICLMDSMDHIAPASDVARYLRLISEACPAVQPFHSRLPDFFGDARRTVRLMPTRHGELREPAQKSCGYLWLIPNCVSARVRLKQANDACQNLLEKWAEPLVALAGQHGARIPERFLKVAWQQVVTNHAHDSICGCSIDQVHRDMMYRFDQARVLAEQLRHQSLGALTADCRDLARTPDEFTLTIANPLPYARDEVVVFDVDLPPDYPARFRDGFNTQDIKAFELQDAKGRTVPYQRLAFVPMTQERSRHAQFCFISDGEFIRYTVAARVALPAMGFASLRVVPSARPVRTCGSLRTGPASAANDALALTVEPNGTLTLLDKATGEVYRDLLTFEDRSEVGDGWFHGHSINDEQWLSTASPAQVSVVHDGPELVTFRSTVTLQVPARYDTASERPADTRIALAVSNVITLRRGARVVDVETTVENTAEDHRLQVLFPTDMPSARTYLAHQPYDFVVRPIALDARTADWQEMDQVEKPFLGLQSVGAGRRGLAFISAGGLHEGGVRDDARRTLQVTLLRSTRKTVGTGGEPDGLQRGRLTYRFALLPFRGTLPRLAALTELARLQAGLSTRQTGKRSSGFPPMAGAGAPTRGFVELRSGRLVLAALKPPEQGDGIVLRLWNPSGSTAQETIRFWKPVASAEPLRLSEDADPAAPQPAIRGPTVTVRAPAHRIVTLRIRFHQPRRGSTV